MEQHFDIIIVGAGNVGLSFALALDPQYSIAIIDNKAKPTAVHAQQYDARVFAINEASEAFFKSIDIWSAIKSQRVSPYQKMFVWDSSGDGQIEFDCRSNGQPYLGHIIENKVINHAMLNACEQRDNITLFFEQQCQHLQCYQHQSVLLTQTKAQTKTKIKTPLQKWTADCLIGADGANSWTRQHAGIDIEQHPYEHTAIVCTVRTSQPHQKTAWQVFRPEGPLAFLPLDDKHHCSIVWSTTMQHAEHLMQLSDDDFCHELNIAFENRLGKIESADKRYSFPLMRRHAKQYAKNTLALMGDAAHTIHPLAGQGINLGFADARCLATILNSSNQFNASLLQQYQRLRRGENAVMLTAMGGFKSLFASDLSLVKLARNRGLNMVNHSNIAKQLFMDGAAGRL